MEPYWETVQDGKSGNDYTIEKGSQESTTKVRAENDGTTSITSNLQTVFAMIEQDGRVTW